jgi:hypothetical protein
MQLKLISAFRKIYKTFEALRQKRWTQLGITAVLILVMIWFIGSYLARDWGQLSQLKIKINVFYLLTGAGYYGINYFLLFFGWHILFRAYNPQIDWLKNLLYYSYSSLMRFLPTPIWFFASRVSLYEQAGTRKRLTVITTFFETFLHVSTGICFYTLLLIDIKKPITIIPFFLCLSFLAFAIIRPDIFHLPVLTGEDRGKIMLRSKDIFSILLLFTFTWAIAGPFYASIIKSISPDTVMTTVDMWKVWILSSMVSYLSAYTLGGIGVLREFSMTLLLNRWFSPPIALIITILVRLMMTFAGIFWAFLAIGFNKIQSFFRNSQLY